jgi:RNA polymerase sigma-70 factor (ECF subfamily)
MSVMPRWFETSRIMSCCCATLVSTLAREHAGTLAGIARHEGIGPADALDVVQEAFQRLLARPDRASLSTDDALHVLSAIVRNAARNLRRRHHRAKVHVPVDDTPLVAAVPPADAVLEQAAALAQLAGCMTELGDTHRHVVTLRVLEELSGDEAVAALGVTPGHVAVLLHRARRQLARCMDADT